MEEDDLFGVRNPETEEIGFVSVMGSLGEHHAIAVYPGAEGLDGFWRLHTGEALDYPEEVLEVPQLQASFEDRGSLTKKDRDVIKVLGLKFRGRQAWPMYRSYRPGYFPWHLEMEEVRFLTWALEQLVEIAPRFRENPEMLGEGDRYLIREAQGSGGRLEWSQRVMTVAPVEPEPIPIPMDGEALERLRGIRRGVRSVEIDLFMFPAQFGKRGERPSCAYMLLVVEGESGMVLGSELLSPEPTLETVYGKVPLTVVYMLVNVGLFPEEVRVRSDLLFQLLGLLMEPLDFEVRWVPALPMLDQAKEFLVQRFV
jgi:hypothetical protein